MEQTKSNKTGIELIAEERAEQTAKHGWTAEHDDTHDRAEMAIVAAELLCEGTDASVGDRGGRRDMWRLCHKLRNDRIHRLKVAGALVAAELDRELRKGI